jgi:methyl-accepting chemotaxis protein
MLHRIATAIEEQSTTVSVISGDVNTLSEIAQSNAASSDQVASSLTRLAQVAEEANRQVERFRT